MPFTITFKRAGSNDIEEINYDATEILHQMQQGEK